MRYLIEEPVKKTIHTKEKINLLWYNLREG